MIVIEGMDVTGKSTLARIIARHVHYSIQESEGPPKSREEINDRVRRYAGLEKTVFVRHPVVSNAIYSEARGEPDDIAEELRREFYSQRNLLIYCEPTWRGRTGDHILKDHDTPGHLRLLETQGILIHALYRQWAMKHAQFVYRIGDGQEQIVRMASGYFY